MAEGERVIVPPNALRIQAELLELIPEFISGVRWRGEEGVQVTEEMKVCVAAEACIPILRLRSGLEIYRRLIRSRYSPGSIESFRAGSCRRCRWPPCYCWHWAKEGMNNGRMVIT